MYALAARKMPRASFGSVTGATGQEVACTGACYAGKFGNVTEGTSTSSACSECGPGSFVPTPAATECEDCPRGQFGNTTGQAIQLFVCPHRCPPGKFGPSAGAASVTDACADCPAGSFNPTPGGLSEDACFPCPHGTIAATPHASHV